MPSQNQMGTPTRTGLNMVPGYRYRIEYKSDAQRKNHWCVMSYLGQDNDDYIMNARPVAGTQSIPKRWVISVRQVPSTEKVVIDKIVR